MKRGVLITMNRGRITSELLVLPRGIIERGSIYSYPSTRILTFHMGIYTNNFPNGHTDGEKKVRDLSLFKATKNRPHPEIQGIDHPNT